MQFLFGCPILHFIVFDIGNPTVRAEQETCVTLRCAFFFYFFDSSTLVDLNVSPELCYKKSTFYTIFLRFRDRAARPYEVTGELQFFYILMCTI